MVRSQRLTIDTEHQQISVWMKVDRGVGAGYSVIKEDGVSDDLKRAAEAIASSGSLWIGTGAGMGVDSGLPDFRGDQGFWKAYPRYEQLGLSFQDLAQPGWFDTNPHQAWGFYGHRLNLYRGTVPHEGYRILKRWAEARDDNCFNFTSNIDGQFQKAGFLEDELVECHGSLHHLQCSADCCHKIWSADSYQPMVDEETMLAEPPLPKCSACGVVARPNVLMFNDRHWLTFRAELQAHHYRQWIEAVGPDNVGLEFGAGKAVPSVRYEAAKISGKRIRINPREADPNGGSQSVGAKRQDFKNDQLAVSKSNRRLISGPAVGVRCASAAVEAIDGV